MSKRIFIIELEGEGVEFFGHDDFELLLRDYCHKCSVKIKNINPHCFDLGGPGCNRVRVNKGKTRPFSFTG